MEEINTRQILAPSMNEAIKIKKAQVLQGKKLTGISETSPKALALDLLRRYYAESGRIFSHTVLKDDEATLLLYAMIKNNPSAYTLIPEESLALTTVTELYNQLKVIRLAKLKDFNDDKALQLKKIIDDYERLLSSKKYEDEVSLINKACSIIHSPVDDGLYISEDTLHYLPYKTKMVVKSNYRNIIKIKLSRHEIGDQTVSTSLYKIYGQVNEVQKIIQDLEDNSYNYGDVHILYTNEIYESILRSALGEHNIPHAFVTPVKADVPTVTILKALINWIGQDYDYTALYPLFNNKLVEGQYHFIKEGGYEFGRAANIGFGLDRYAMFVDQLTNHKQNYLDILLKHGMISQYQYDRVLEDKDGHYKNFAELINQLSQVPVKTNQSAPASLFNYMAQIVLGFHPNAQERDLINNGTRYFSMNNDQMDLTSALKMIEDYVDNMKMSNEERQDVITIEKLNQATVLNRPHQYLIGMAFDYFDNIDNESPILTDHDKALYLDDTAGYVSYQANAYEESKAALIHTLESQASGTLTITAPYYDTFALKPMTVSRVFDQLSKTSTVNTIHQYPHTIDQDTRIINHRQLQKTDARYVLKKDIEVAQDGHRIFNIRISPSKLKSLLECPYKYLYQLMYFPNKEEKDKVIYLKPNEKGNLFHGVLREYAEANLKDSVIRPFIGNDQKKLRDIFEQWAYDYNILYPAANENRKDYEMDHIWQGILNYTKHLHEELSTIGKDWTIKECEHEIDYTLPSFNTDGQAYDGTGDEFRITIHGYIDRIDVKHDGSAARIIDYKTGDAKDSYIEPKNVEDIPLQSVLYPLAYQGETGTDVTEFFYEFPYEKPMKAVSYCFEGTPGTPNYHYDRVGVEKKVNEEIIRRIVEVYANDNYLIQGSNACTYCDFKEICLKNLGLEDGSKCQ